MKNHFRVVFECPGMGISFEPSFMRHGLIKDMSVATDWAIDGLMNLPVGTVASIFENGKFVTTVKNEGVFNK